jgi:predicted enzyme related to lactoylglutathione lyase
MRRQLSLLVLGSLCGCASTLSAAQEDRTMARLDYVELPATDIETTRSFYERAFGWTMTQFAPTYSATTTGDTDVGLQADPGERQQAPLPVIQVKDLEGALLAVEGAGGTIVKPILSFPGGRRFHFRDPSGNELAAWEAAAE